MAIKRDALFSSKSDEWATPRDLFDKLNTEFNFTLDPCATDDNHLTDKYFTARDDGLLQSWGGHRVFANPPYSSIEKWVRKAYEESRKPGTVVVLLIPSRTDTRYFHNYIYHRAEIRFIRGRLKFGNAIYNAPFPSMIVIYRAAGEFIG